MTQEQENTLAKLVRFTNGDDVITELVELSENDVVEHYMIINPLKIMYMGSSNPGYLQIAFLPFVFPRICDKQEFLINAKDVLFVSDISSNMNEHYWNSIDSLYEEQSEPSLKKALMEQLAEEEMDDDDYSTKKTLH